MLTTTTPLASGGPPLRLLFALALPTLLGAVGLYAAGSLTTAFWLYVGGGCALGPWLLLGARPFVRDGGLPFAPPSRAGRRGELALILLFGPIFLAIYLLVRPWLGDVSDYQVRVAALGIDLADPLAAGLVFIVLNPLLEEWWWRGQATPRCCARFGRRAGLALATGGFGVYHVVLLAALFPLPLALLRAGLITAAGLLWSHLALRWRSWRGVYLAHLAADVAMAVLFALVVVPSS